MTPLNSPRPSSVSPSEFYKTTPPAFGHDALSLFEFEPNYVNLNHGTYASCCVVNCLSHQPLAGSCGSLPLPVRAFCDELTDEVESNPDRFMWYTCSKYLNSVRGRVAKLIGAQTDECVIVNNTSHGLATILHNFNFNEEDILVQGAITITDLHRGFWPHISTQRQQHIAPCLKCSNTSQTLHLTPPCRHLIFDSRRNMQTLFETLKGTLSS